jgi:hypothetical protein
MQIGRIRYLGEVILHQIGVAKDAVPWDEYTAGDRSAPPLPRHAVDKFLHRDEHHGLLDVIIENQVLDVGFV